MAQSILLGAFVVLIISFIIALISPFSFLFRFKRVKALEFGRVKMYWFHPWVLYGLYDFKTHFLDIRLFKFFIVYSQSVNTQQNGGDHGREDGAAVGGFVRTETDTGTVYEAPGGIQYPQGPEPEKPDIVNAVGEKTKKEGPVARLRSMQERFGYSSLRKALFFLCRESWRHKIGRWLGRTVSPLFHLFVIHRIRIHVRAGFMEPSVTGKIYGYWMGVSHALRNRKMKKNKMVFEPAFNNECLEIEALLHVRTSLLRFMIPVVIMVVTFPYFSTFKAWRTMPRRPRRKTARPRKKEDISGT
jgi:hypothetical protein